ncbi:hypothetical protein PQR14_27595 [Paraburkholderia bryophila]|uniref:hypothetical protein n=1 Tax=Paraburkholderia bryophila TaxID=420952 RepID=UPI0038BD8776
MSSIKTTYGRDGNLRFRVRVKYKGEVRSKTFHTSEADAQAWADQQLEEMKSTDIVVGTPAPLTIGAMIQEFLRDFPGYDQAFVDGVNALSHLTPDRVSAELILATFPDMGQEAVFLEYAVEWGRHNGVFVKQNPVAAARRVFDKLPYRPVEDSEMELLVAKARENDEHEYLAAFLSLIMDGALKQVEALRIRRQHIDLHEGQLELDGRCVPLNPETISLLEARMALVDSDELFGNVTVKQSKSRLSDYCKSLGIDEVKFPDLRREGAYRLCLRYGSARAWAMLGNPSTANSAWMIVAAERNRRLVEVLGPLPDFSL